MKNINKHFIITVLFAAGISISNAGNWIKDAATGCRLWNPNPQKHETISWYGDIKDNKADGYGTAVWKVRGEETERAAGQWKDGRLNGLAVWTHVNGYMYAGEWKDGKKSGCGRYTKPDGSIFLGQYDNDRIDIGRTIAADGKRLTAIESSQVRSLAYKAQDAAILARRAATRAQLESKKRIESEAAAISAAVTKLKTNGPCALEHDSGEATEPEEDPSAK
jgi:hypothetical protein